MVGPERVRTTARDVFPSGYATKRGPESRTGGQSHTGELTIESKRGIQGAEAMSQAKSGTKLAKPSRFRSEKVKEYKLQRDLLQQTFRQTVD